MSDATTKSRVTREPRKAKYPVKTDQFIAACAAKDATTNEARARLLGVTEKQAYEYVKGHVQPGVLVAIRIANKLGVSVTDLWDADREAAA